MPFVAVMDRLPLYEKEGRIRSTCVIAGAAHDIIKENNGAVRTVIRDARCAVKGIIFTDGGTRSPFGRGNLIRIWVDVSWAVQVCGKAVQDKRSWSAVRVKTIRVDEFEDS